jgi:hypothetical protein
MHDLEVKGTLSLQDMAEFGLKYNPLQDGLWDGKRAILK